MAPEAPRHHKPKKAVPGPSVLILETMLKMSDVNPGDISSDRAWTNMRAVNCKRYYLVLISKAMGLMAFTGMRRSDAVLRAPSRRSHRLPTF